MDLVNRKVKSKALGIGTVVEHDDSYVIVQFAAKKSTFQYPEAFRKFLTAEDDDIQQALLEKLQQLMLLLKKLKSKRKKLARQQSKLS